MALVIGIRVDVNNEIMIGDTLVTVDKIVGRTQAQITVHGACMIEEKIINKEEMTTIMNGVKMGLGSDTNRGGLLRVLVEAHKKITIVNKENGTYA